MKCNCGCSQEAKWLVNGYCTPERSRIIDEPCCDDSMGYLRDYAIIYRDPFSAIPLLTETKPIINET